MIRIGVVVYPGFQLLDAAGPIGAFEVANRSAPNAYDLRVLAAEPGLAASSSGAVMQAEPLAEAGPLHTLLVVGGARVRQAIDSALLLDAVRAHAAEGRRTASVCTGAFVLAAAGVLDGRRATTHWGATVELARRFPKVRVEPDRIFVRDDHVWTSAGITAGIDLALALIEADLGPAVARAAARHLVIPHRRAGGQSQFSALQETGAGERFAPVLAFARERLAEPLPVERLAEQAALSPRQFARAFTAAVGVTPAKAVERLRLEAARAALETEPGASVQTVARRTGFDDPERMRRAFVRVYGHPPRAVRRAGA